MINCKEVVIKPNEDSTYKLEFVGCKFTDDNGKKVEGNIIFPRVSEEDSNSIDKDAKFHDFKPRFIPLITDEQSEIFSIYIPK